MATEQDIGALRSILQEYEVASGQLLNLQKSSVVFSDNVPAARKIELSSLCGVALVEEHDTYLGLPTVVGRNRSTVFAYLPEWVAQKLKGWKGSELSIAGKEVLVKSVIQALPIYAMGCFLLPLKTCHELEKLVRRFWWGGTEDKRKTHWLAWEKIMKPREDGGLGFRDFRDFNIALLAKQSWRFLQKPDSLVNRVFQSKYYRGRSILEAKFSASSHISYAFRSIMAGRELLKSGLTWEIGSGCHVNIFKDPWVTRVDSVGLFTPCPTGLENVSVASLMVAGQRLWDVAKLQQTFLPIDVAAICNTPIREVPHEDRLYWRHSDDGLYSVSSGYIAQMRISTGDSSSSAGQIDRPILSKLWKLKVPKKCIYPIWRLWHGSLAVGTKFRERGMQVDPCCSNCEGGEESEEHLFYMCPFAQRIWEEVSDLEFIASWTRSIKDLIIHVLSYFSSTICEKFVMIIWGMWRCRNDRRFNNRTRDETEVRRLSLDHLLWFKEARSVYGLNVAAGNEGDKWRAPAVGTYLINCDAAFPENSRFMGLGTVIRGSDGLFAAGKFARRFKTRSVLLAELQALWMGLQLAKDLQFQRVELQSDSLTAIKLLRDGFSGKIREDDALAEMKIILDKCNLLAGSFSSISYSFIGRSGNNLAHLFAQRGVVEDDMSFFFTTPTWATDVLSVDLLGLAPHVL